MLNKSKLNAYWRLARLDRPIGTLLLLWPTLTALWFAADGVPDYKVLILFCCGVLFMRAAGCVINDFADREVDGKVQRTKGRPLATKELTSKEAIGFFMVLSVLSLILVLQLNLLTIQLAFVAMALTIFYPFAKRFFVAPQMVLATVWSWSIVMAYAAQSGQVSMVTWLLFIANWCLTMAYDTMYAMVDREDDLKIGVKSTAVWFGSWDKFWIGTFQLLYLLSLTVITFVKEIHWSFSLAIMINALLLIKQQWWIKDRDKKLCFKAFLDNNNTTLIIFIGAIVSLGLE
ncbi:4-hydroxybenzoate octaprenyltransferase [Paraferrimonas sp. SM1919]|uniref:4-hydroxybenzoate octaprenyltransferase n=1 Tax=Paraferrimonas sp. SM1919 TaxID=2662263 RepID=UPI001969F68A|nr:4-hydroxybenzoate octaprenyltransferase [Paraferrimonas sp. SM1919]